MNIIKTQILLAIGRFDQLFIIIFQGLRFALNRSIIGLVRSVLEVSMLQSQHIRIILIFKIL